jgi:hypothetical protein
MNESTNERIANLQTPFIIGLTQLPKNVILSDRRERRISGFGLILPTKTEIPRRCAPRNDSSDQMSTEPNNGARRFDVGSGLRATRIQRKRRGKNYCTRVRD